MKNATSEDQAIFAAGDLRPGKNDDVEIWLKINVVMAK